MTVKYWFMGGVHPVQIPRLMGVIITCDSPLNDNWLPCGPFCICRWYMLLDCDPFCRYTAA